MTAFHPSAMHTNAGKLVCNYVQAFNDRDFEAMKSVFHPQLVTIHPDEPGIDVTEVAPFLERMIALWPRGLKYTIRRICEHANDSDSEAWVELMIGNPKDSPLATEVVIYQEHEGHIAQLTVYKLMHPSHPNYQRELSNDVRP